MIGIAPDTHRHALASVLWLAVATHNQPLTLAYDPGIMRALPIGSETKCETPAVCSEIAKLSDQSC